jgi:hypothetical protein
MTHYQLVFVTDSGARRSFRVNKVNPAISAQNLQAAIDMLIANDIMSAERGALSRLQGITLNTVSATNPLA